MNDSMSRFARRVVLCALTGTLAIAVSLAAGCVPRAAVYAPAPDAVYVPQAPPPAVHEAPPPAPAPRMVWKAGHWRWDRYASRYVWVQGRWEHIKPGRAWVPGHWRASPRGHYWVSGHWR